MKAFKIIAIVLGSIALLALILVALAFTPSIQTWAVRKAVAGQPGTKIELSGVGAGLSRTELTGLRVEQAGMILTADKVSANYSAWDYISGKKINVDDVAIDGLVVDLRDAKPAATPAANAAATTPAPASASKSAAASSTSPATTQPPAFDGALKLTQLPFDLRVAKLALKGRALLPAGQTATFDVSGAGIETGQKGKLDWKIEFADATKGAPLAALQAAGSLALHLAADRRVDSVELETIATASGPNLPAERLRVTLKADQPTAGGNETYALSVGFIRADNPAPLLSSNIEYQAAAHQFAGTWKLGADRGQLAALLAGLGLPDLTAQGNGAFTFDPTTNAASARGELNATAAQLEKLSPALAAVGSVQVRTAFDARFANNVAQLDKLELDVTGTDGRKFAQVATLQKVSFSVADKRVTLADPKAQLARVTVQALPLAWAQPVAKPLAIDSGDLSLTLGVEASADGSRIAVRAIDPLTLRAVTVRQGDKKLVEQLALSVRPQIDYTAEKITAELTELKISLPAGDAVGGKLSASVTDLAKTPVIDFAAQLDAKLIAALKPYLPLDPGPIVSAVSAEGRFSGQTLALAKMFVTASQQANNALLLALETKQPLTLDLQKTTIALNDPAKPAATVRLGEIPLAWAQAFVPKSQFAGVLAGAALEVSARSADDLALRTTEPLVVRGASVTLDNQKLAQNLDVAVDLSATKKGDVATYDVRRLEVTQGKATVLKVVAAGEANLGAKFSATAKGNLEADVAAALAQPVLAPYATLSRGNVATVFEGSVGDTTSVKAVVTARNLIVKQTGAALGTVEVSAVASLKADGSGVVKLPLVVTAGDRRSDVTFEGSFAKTGTAISATGKLSSTQLFADDLQAFSELAPATPPQVATTPAKPTLAPAVATKPVTPAANARDTVPFWSGVTAKLDTDLKKIVYGRDYIVSGVKGSFVVNDTKLGVDSLEGRFKENPFKLVGVITFDPKKPTPYTLTGNTTVTNLDLGEILRAANPNEKPAIETKVSVNAKLNGSGRTMNDLIQNSYGVFDVTGTAGTLRALGKKGEVAGVLGGATQLIGAFVTKSDGVVAAGELASELKEMAFDKFSLHVERGADLNLKLTNLEFISPNKRITGTGGITFQKDVPIDQQPMQISVQLAAKDQFAVVLNRLRLLKNEQDDKGYYLMSESFSVGGTAANPDSKALWAMVAKAGVGALLR